ncbi:MAG: c-type cytochrome biogenesis protein CcsB [Cyanobacteria bacterium SZAS-4]|nr:c-type cytochrome biogenesis protein CcsB [Cyanobacteria bacterium SZAS-4]
MSDFQLALTNTAGVSSVASFWVFVASNGVKKYHDKMLKVGSIVMAIGFVALTLAIIARGVEAQRFPLANLYESLLWFAWATMGGYLALASAYGIRQLGWLAAMLAATMFLYGSWLPANQQTITPLVPALVSYWRQIHVPPLIVSYAMFFLSGLSSLLELYHAKRKVSLGLSIGTIFLAFTAIGLGTFTTVDTKWLQLLFVGASLGGTIGAYYTLKMTRGEPNVKQAELYDDVSYRAIAIGFPLLTIGIITGGLWANHAWGTYWSWDPKESMALVTWLSYAAYIHLRIHHEASAEKLSVVSVAGLLLTLLTYLGFNSLGFGGLHSYGKLK